MIKIDEFGFIDISTVGTKYSSFRYNPKTREIITTAKFSRGNSYPEPIRSNMSNLYKELEWDEEWAKETYASKMKIIKRVDKVASEYRKQVIGVLQ